MKCVKIYNTDFVDRLCKTVSDLQTTVSQVGSRGVIVDNLATYADLSTVDTSVLRTNDTYIINADETHGGQAWQYSWSGTKFVDAGPWAVNTNASNINYDNTASGLLSATVQAAIDELKTEIEAIPIIHQLSNQSGQVKIRFIDLTTTGFVGNEDVILSIRGATATESPAPTTLWPQKSIDENTNNYSSGFFVDGGDESLDRLRENNVLGQIHRWRVAGNYSNKDIGNMGRLRCFLTNPDTGFKVSAALIIPAGITGDDFTFEFTSISDNDSLDLGRGYVLGFQTSYDDPALTVTVNSIVRISEAIDPLK